MRVADHLEHRVRLRHAVDGEARIEDLVPAMLAVGLGEHHQFDVGRVAREAGERVHQVVDLVVAEREAEFGVGCHHRVAAEAEHIDMRHRLSGLVVEQVARVVAREQHALGHAVVQQIGAGPQLLRRQRLRAAEQAAAQAQPPLDDPLDAADRQPAVVGDVGRLGGPRRNRAQARRDDDQGPVRGRVNGLAVVQQCRQPVRVDARQRRVAPRPVHMPGLHAGDPPAHRLQARQQCPRAKTGQGVAAFEVKQVLGGRGHAVGPGGDVEMQFQSRLTCTQGRSQSKPGRCDGHPSRKRLILRGR